MEKFYVFFVIFSILITFGQFENVEETFMPSGVKCKLIQCKYCTQLPVYQICSDRCTTCGELDPSFLPTVPAIDGVEDGRVYVPPETERVYQGGAMERVYWGVLGDKPTNSKPASSKKRFSPPRPSPKLSPKPSPRPTPSKSYEPSPSRSSPRPSPLRPSPQQSRKPAPKQSKMLVNAYLSNLCPKPHLLQVFYCASFNHDHTPCCKSGKKALTGPLGGCTIFCNADKLKKGVGANYFNCLPAVGKVRYCMSKYASENELPPELSGRRRR